MVDLIARWFNAGGSFMWVILAVLSVAVAVMIERLLFYFVFCRGKAAAVSARIAAAIERNDLTEARRIAGQRTTPLFALLSTAVARFEHGASAEEIQESVEEAAIIELPRMSERLNYLALFANIATLLGLLGTIFGLQVSFSSLATVEAAQKATMLAKGISQAMNTTAFGLIVAVPCMVMYTMLSNRQQRLLKELDDAVVRLMNFMKKQRP
jgi:biopolymer transport protein ExbB/TolQ